MNKTLFAGMWLLASMPAFSQTTLQVKVSNNSKTPRSQVPVVVQLASTGVEAQSDQGHRRYRRARSYHPADCKYRA